MTDALEEATSARRQLADALRDLRISAKLDQATLAQHIDVVQPQISRIENSRRIPSVEIVTAWAHTCAGLLGNQVDVGKLVRLAEAAAAEQISWRRAHAQGLASHQEAIGRLEQRATGIRVFQCSIIPGQLQIGAYIRRVLQMGAAETGPADLATAVQARLERQLILHNPPPGGCDFLITEAALRWRPIGDDDGRLLTAQLDRLLAVLDLPGVDLRVIPWELPQPATHRHPFVLFTFGEADDNEPEGMVIVETVDGEDVIRAPDRIAAYQARFDLLSGAALGGTAARGLIRRIIADVSRS